VKELAYQFLYFAEGLNIGNPMLKDIFNTSLNEPVPAWEMGMLGILELERCSTSKTIKLGAGQTGSCRSKQ